MPEFDALELDEVLAKQSPVVLRNVVSIWSVFDDYQPTQLREKYAGPKRVRGTTVSGRLRQRIRPRISNFPSEGIVELGGFTTFVEIRGSLVRSGRAMT
ncbi:hypothetical protein [Nocardia sp. NPDC004722]